MYGEQDLADEIIVHGGTDYKYRVSISKEDFAAFMTQEITQYLGYDNFKNALVSARGDQWGKAAMDVWVAMWKVEDDE